MTALLVRVKSFFMQVSLLVGLVLTCFHFDKIRKNVMFEMESGIKHSMTVDI